MQRKYSASLWLPLIVAIVSLTATLVVFRALRNQERFQVERVVKLATYSIEADMVADMNLRIRGLADLARLWSISPIPKREEFDLRGTLYMSQVPGCIAVGWVDSSLSSDWSLPVGGDSIARQVVSGADEKTRMRLQSLAESRESLVGHSLILAHEERVLPVWTPVFAGKQFRGFLLGVFRVQPLLEDILSDHADLGYEVQVAEDKDPIFKLTSAIPENRWAQEARVPLPGVDWHLRIWPGPKALPEMLPLSQVVLLGGLIMCIQLTLTVYLALRERGAALYADQINRELTAENNERRRAEESLHVLSSRLLTLQDEERRHLARELHDSTAQILYGLVIKLKLLSQTVATESAVVHDSIYESIELADQCQRDLRTMSYLLHPPSLDDLGLAPALRTLVNGFSERSGIQAVLDTPENLRRLPRDVETALFRIVQESLSNVHRHSGSKGVNVWLSQIENREIRLKISDTGIGFDPTILGTAVGLGVGIAGMRERVRQLGGRLEITSSREGTVVEACLPVPESASDSGVIAGKSILKRLYGT